MKTVIKNGFMKKCLKLLVYFLVLLAIIANGTLFLTAIYKFVNPVTTPMMIIKSKNGIQREWVGYGSISKNMVSAVVASEDQKFYSHHGFDIEAIKEAYKTNKWSRQKRGASTISQQVAKNVFLLPSRNFVRKGVEAYFTVLIEYIWGKKRIAEVYLNVAEMGKGIYGVESAAKHYFSKRVHAKILTKYQAASIAAILPNPIYFSPYGNNSYMASKIDRIVYLMWYYYPDSKKLR